MNIKCLLLAIMLFPCMLTAQEGKGYVRVLKQSEQMMELELKTGDLRVHDYQTVRGNYQRLRLPGFTPSTEVGNPELPVYVQWFEIPYHATVDIKIIEAIYDTLIPRETGLSTPIYPVQPSQPKTNEPDSSWEQNLQVYNTDNFYGMNLLSMNYVGIFRDMNLAALYFSPIRYNPVSGVIVVCKEVKVSLWFRDGDLSKTVQVRNLYNNNIFRGQFSRVIPLNISLSKQIAPVTVPLGYIVIADPMFRGELDTFALWKSRIGYTVELHYTDEPEVGNTSISISNFLKNRYEESSITHPAPAFVLLVGDVQQIPAFERVDYVSDLPYFTWSSNDGLPDCYYGRMSARDKDELAAQISKTLAYEQLTMPDCSYLQDAVLVAGSDALYADLYSNAQLDYLLEQYFNEQHGFRNIYSYYYQDGGGTRDTEADSIRAQLGRGTGWANYTAHCTYSGWSTPAFLQSHAKELDNREKFGIMIGNCCKSASFQQMDCLGETLTKMPDRGAVAYIGASGDTYWAEDFYWSVGARDHVGRHPTYENNHTGMYDCLFHDREESPASWCTTAGSMVVAGNMSVEMTLSPYKNTYWEIYHLLGDPSLMPYTRIPVSMPVTFDSLIYMGATTLRARGAPYAYTALTRDGLPVAATFANDSGEAILHFPPLLQQGNYELAWSATNYTRQFAPVKLVKSQEAYLSALLYLDSITGHVPAGSHVQGNLKIQNHGTDTAYHVRITLHSESHDMNIVPLAIYVDTIPPDTMLDIVPAFSWEIDSFMPDQTVISLSLSLDDDTISRIFHYSLKTIAPQLRGTGFEYENMNTGSRDFDAGDIVRYTIFLTNEGHTEANNCEFTLAIPNPEIKIVSPQKKVEKIKVGDTITLSFILQISPQFSSSTLVPVVLTSVSETSRNIDTLSLSTRQVVEDFESGNLEKYSWEPCSPYEWTITNEKSCQGNYSLRSYENLPNQQTSAIELRVETPYPDYLSFLYTTSTEKNYDIFAFYIDDILLFSCSGELPCQEQSFLVNKGIHRLRFAYSKDLSARSGEDAVWIDCLKIPGQVAITGTRAMNTGSKTTPVIYPNPAKAWVSIRADFDIATCRVINMLGIELFCQPSITRENTLSFSVANLPSGMYFITIEDTQKQSFILKLIKE
ncbi:MAG: C25 family cysteine peptidase [Bacteroidales bacterium]|jgi:uncharacterized repeat protein (TIGR01451 family)|nr:C25 family cysteine peptidase [Bacteroidales bacterium]